MMPNSATKSAAFTALWIVILLFGVAPKTVNAADWNGNPEAYSVDISGTRLINLTNHSGQDFNPAWSPGGDMIAFNRGDHSAAISIHTVYVDGSNSRFVIDALRDNSSKQSSFRNDERPAFAKSITVKELSEKVEANQVLLLDVRLKEDFERDTQLIPGATYLDPEKLATWSATLPRDAEIVVYCVAGKWVSQKVAALLHAQGLRVSSLAGGIEAWKKSHEY